MASPDDRKESGRRDEETQVRISGLKAMKSRIRATAINGLSATLPANSAGPYLVSVGVAVIEPPL